MLGNLVELLHLRTGDKVGEEYIRHQGEEHAEASSECERHPHPAHLLLEYCWVVDDLLERHHCQEGDGELGYDEDGGHGAELGIHRYVVEEEVGERHEVLAPREQDAQHGAAQQGPLHGTFDDKQSQDEQQHHEGTHIDGTARAGLFTPILANLLIELQVLRIGLLHGFGVL